MKTTTYSGNINDFQLPELVKKTNKTSIILSIVLIIFALAIFHLVYLTENNLVEGSEVFAGVIALSVALFMLIWQRTKFIDKETGSVVSKDSIYYNPNDLPTILLAFDNDNFAVLQNVKRQQEGNVQIVFRFAENHRYIAVQVQRYEPFDYKPQTDILVYRDANAMKLMENLK